MIIRKEVVKMFEIHVSIIKKKFQQLTLRLRMHDWTLKFILKNDSKVKLQHKKNNVLLYRFSYLIFEIS